MISEELFSKEGVSANFEQLAQLQKIFPNCFDASGRFLLEKFQSEISEQADISREFYEMNWLGKSYAKLLRNLPPETLLCEDKARNAKPENKNSQNLLIQGDNLDVLKHLKNAYANKVKMIYIDPPYNTGSDGFVYQDDRKFTPEQLCKLAHISLDEAERILKFTAKGSNSHSTWLTFMYPRLYIARDLLKEDGVIFVSIDDNEVAQLKLLCDEVFGEGNFVGQFPWRKRTAKSDVPFGVSADYEFVLAYAKSGQFLASIEGKERKYLESDDYPNRPWRIHDLTTQRNASERPNSFFDLVDPKTGKVYPANPNATWRVTKDTFQEYYDKGKIVFPDDYDFLNISRPVMRYFKDDDIKKAGEHFGRIAVSTKLPEEVGMSLNGTKEITDIFDRKLFDFPKPSSLIKFLVKTLNDKNAVICDFFAGSGTTAHAVMQLNTEDGGNRQFILVQLPEKTDEKSEAFKAGYKTIFDITKARIEKAATQIQAQNPNASGDFGFRIYQTTDNFRRHSDDEFSPEQVNLPYVENLTDKQMDTLLTTWALNDGALLTDPICEVKLGNYTAHLCDKNLYLLQTGFTSADLLTFIQKLDNDTDFNPNRVIVFGENMPSHLQQELNQAIETYSNKKNIALSLIIRN